MKTNRISYFRPPVTNTRPSESLSLQQVYERIKDPRYFLSPTLSLWDCKSPVAARKYKANSLPYVTFGGVFRRRNNKDLMQASGLMVLDFDNLHKPDWFKKLFSNNDLLDTRLIFISPSGTGLKVVLGYEHKTISHEDYFKQVSEDIARWYGLQADKSGSDVSRACFLGHDPDVWICEAVGFKAVSHKQ